MLKILSGNQVKILDLNHQQELGISSLELMEKAAHSFVEWWAGQSFQFEKAVAIFVGPGNNGGDGLAIARLLSKGGINVNVFTCFDSEDKLSPDTSTNLNLLPAGIPVESWTLFDSSRYSAVIDSFLGVGLRGELRPKAISIIEKINSFLGKGPIYSVDLPSGLPSDESLSNLTPVVSASFTLTFSFPKLSLLLPEHASVVGELVLLDIGIPDESHERLEGEYYYLQKKDVIPLHRRFHRFSHKGDFGKVLIWAGQKGKMGAAILAAKAALRTGSGLVTLQIPEFERQIIQIAVPEAMCVFDPVDSHDFDAIALGPGLGQKISVEVLSSFFTSTHCPLVIDADGLNLLASHPELIAKIPKGSILTPHLGEFSRLFGTTYSSHLDRIKVGREFCLKYELNLVIKGANSAICLADGRVIFNSSGTKHMATGGVGDVLSGMLVSLLGQGYSPISAVLCGVYHHGLAGEIAGSDYGRSMIATDLVEAIPESFLALDID